MEEVALKDPDVYPGQEVLKKALGKSHPAFERLIDTVTIEPFRLVPEWRYYNDGKAWLCKVCHKKKTIFWLSVWEGGYFKTGFYFTEKTGSGIYDLDIPEGIKEDFSSSKPTGKIIPLVLEFRDKSLPDDILKIIRYKLKQ